MKKKTLITILLASVMVITTSVASFAGSYSDLPKTNWAYPAVNTMSDKGIVKGYSDGSFKPNSTVTYAEFIKMAVIAAGNEDPGNASEGHWALNYYKLAIEKGYFTESDISAKQLDSKISRGDMSLIISNILGDVKIDNYDKIEALVTDVDYKTKNEYDIIKTYSAGIITGYTDNTFKPEGTLSRAESATVIYRLTDESKRQTPDFRTKEEKMEDAKDDYVLVKSKDYVTNLDETLRYSEVFGDPVKNGGILSEELKYYKNDDYFQLKLVGAWDGKTATIEALNLPSCIYLVKGNKLIDYPTTLGHDNFTASVFYHDVADADYILGIPGTKLEEEDFENGILIDNPFKAK
ncbi:MAG: S-layer homology domain-containing protein [Clostridia bacterium]|nr:S-layer homology domain-containing protein [Clostridia bacterium]